jgi:hypothetical protein
MAFVLILPNVLNAAGLSSLFTTLNVSGILAVAVSLALQTTLYQCDLGADAIQRWGASPRRHDRIRRDEGKGRPNGLRNTWIKTEPGHLVVVGSSSLLGGPLTNYTATERLKKKYAFD